MISSTNAFNGMSAADLMKLFGTDAASASASSSSSSASATTLSTSVSVVAANGSAKAIQAILAEAEVQKAPTAASGGSAVNARVAAAYVANTDSAGASTSASGSDTMAAVNALVTQTDAEVYQTLAPYQGWDPQQHAAGASGSSLVIATANGVSAAASASGGAQSVVAESMALDAYQLNLGPAQYAEANQQTPVPETSAVSKSTSDNTSGSNLTSGYLQLTIRAISGSASEYDAAYAQAQQLVTAFKNQTLTSTSSDVTGFSYASMTNGDGEGFTVTGIVVNSSKVLGDMSSISDVDTASAGSAEKYLLNQSVASFGGLRFAIPLGS